METLDYRQFLQEELVARSKRNPSYSARALARDLDLSPAFLSQILSGKRLLAEERAQTIADKMAWPRWKKKVFTKLVRRSGVQEPALREMILGEIKVLLHRANSRASKAQFNQIQLHEFCVVSGWQHLAIYELTEMPWFKDDPEWIAITLGISALEAHESIERLLRVGLLERSEKGLSKTRGDCRLRTAPSQAIRHFHKQHLDKAKLAIEAQSREERDFSGTTMSIDPKKIPRAKAMIRRFSAELMQFLESGEKGAVYHFGAQLYRLDGGK